MLTLKKRPCGPIKSSKSPQAWTKEELVEKAVIKFNISKSKAMSMTKLSLCTSLVGGKLVDVKTTPKKAKPKVSTIKKTKKEKVSSSPVRSKSPVKAVVKKKKVESPVKNQPLKKPKKSAVSPVKRRSPSKSPKPPKKSAVSPIRKKTPENRKPKNGDCIERSKLTLQNHQKAVVEHFKKHRGLIVAHEVGSGKTLTAVTASQCFLDDYPNGKIIVVTPLSLQENFKKEMKKYGVSKSDMKYYDFYTLQGFATEYKNKKCGSKTNPVMLIIDEAHNLRTKVRVKRSAKNVSRSEVAVECAKVVDKVLLLTATAIYNEPRDLVNLVAMARGTEPLSKKTFESIVANRRTFNKYFSCVFSFYETPKDENYPTSKEHYVEIPITKSYYKKYMEVENVLAGKTYYDAKKEEYGYQPGASEEPDPWVFLTGLRKASNKFEN